MDEAEILERVVSAIASGRRALNYYDYPVSQGQVCGYTNMIP
jgi:hypothetical protein